MILGIIYSILFLIIIFLISAIFFEVFNMVLENQILIFLYHVYQNPQLPLCRQYLLFDQYQIFCVQPFALFEVKHHRLYL